MNEWKLSIVIKKSQKSQSEIEPQYSLVYKKQRYREKKDPNFIRTFWGERRKEDGVHFVFHGFRVIFNGVYNKSIILLMLMEPFIMKWYKFLSTAKNQTAILYLCASL